ncbi:MAG TPA: hypothetical protein VMX17_12435 [Candidatus Glassbacteria bacterium]|nr:hypothetical protein [Candidatus Glassbacteria bacterium]
MFSPKKLLAVLLITAFFASSNIVNGFPSGGEYPPTFTSQSGDWYDSWGFNRNVYWGDDGYLPNIAYESIGSDKELAYSLGEWFRGNYDQRVERAEAILDYVQRWTDYGYDEDNVFKDNIPQEEWAWNADEMAHMFDETNNIVAIGDCEDMSFLCATIYLSAGFDVAIISPPAHVALLIWLPEYDNANYYWDIPDDGREYGWIWVEATGEANPLGWTPPDFDDGDWISYPLSISRITVNFFPQHPQVDDDVLVQVKVDSSIGTESKVLLTYSVGVSNNVVDMNKTGSIYEASIPKQPENTHVVCSVSVEGIEDLTSPYEFEYTVGETAEFPPFVIEIVIVLVIIIFLILFIKRL